MVLSSKTDILILLLVAAAAYWIGIHQQHGASTPLVAGTRKDPTTGIAFSEKSSFHVGKNLNLLGIGTRKKAIVNIYSVGVYVSNPIQRSISASNSKTKKSVCDTILESKSPKAVKLIFAMGVGPEKIAEAVSQLSGVKESVQKAFHDLVLNGMGDGKMKASEFLTFEWKGEDVIAVTVRGKYVGEMKDVSLAKGVLALYVGQKSVSPSLRNDLGCK